MREGWREATLGDVIELKRGYDLPQRERQPGAVPLVSSSGVSDTHSVAKVKGPGVITGRYGTIGSVYYTEGDFWPLNTTLYVRNFKGNDPRFISYFLRRIDFYAYSDKAAVPGLNRNDLHQAKINSPPLLEQRAIAATLGALDDKIELNRKMNATLEAMARVLFRDWFVDFGPTRAKMEGAEPYLSPDLWALFPDRLDEAGKPEGWEIGTLGAVATAKNEVIDPSSICPETPYIGLEHMPRGSIALIEWDGAGKVSSNKAAFAAGDFLFGKLRPYFHKVGIAPVSGVCSTDIVVVRPKADEWSSFVIACISDEDFVRYTDKTSTGTKMPRTSWSIMAKYPVVVPPCVTAGVFNTTLAPLLERVRANIHESRTLAQTRDLLLPRLMSGELRVTDPVSSEPEISA